MNFFFMKIPWKCLEKPMNAFLMPWKQRFQVSWHPFAPWNLEGWFSWAMKSLQKYWKWFSWAMKSLQKHWKWFSWAIKFWSISDWQNSWPMKIQWQPSVYFMGHENSNWPWNSHESISGAFLAWSQSLHKKKKNHENAKLTLE